MKVSKITRTLLCLFALSITGIRLQAQGNECNTSVALTNLNNYCSTARQYSNATSTPSAYGIPSCWGAASYDVWFRFTAVGTDVQMSVTGDGAAGGIRDPRITLYSGTCGGQVIELGCNASAAGANTVTLYEGGLVPGTVYIIRIGTTLNNRGAFKFCITNNTPTVNPGADCDGAVKLCDMSDVKVAGLSGGGKNTGEIDPNSCFKNLIDPNKNPVEGNSSWFKWTCGKSGTLTFDITPNDPTNDLDFILYELTGTSTNACGARTNIRCTATGCPIPNGVVGLNMISTDVNEPMTNQGDPTACSSPIINGFLKYVDMTVGRTYVLMIDNASSASGFTIKFGGTGVFLGPYAKITATGTPTTCVGEPVTYNGSLSNNYSSLAWTFNGGTPPNATTVGPHTVTYTAQGTYKTYLKASDVTCASGNSLDSITITVNPATTLSNAGSAQTVCGPTATMAGNAATAGTGTWTLVSGKGNITSPNSPTSTVTDLGVGPNVFKWTIANPPCSSTNSLVTITSVGIPSIATAGPDQIICGGTTASLSANIPIIGTGTWSVVSGAGIITSPSSPNTTVTALGLGNNVFRWSIANAPCSAATDDVTIKRADLPVIDTSKMVIKAPSCSKSDGAIDSIIVTANSALTYFWNTVSYPSADIHNIPAGSYTLVVKDADDCTSTMGPISVVNPNPPKTPVILSGGNVCFGKMIKVWVVDPLPNVIYTWTGPKGGSLGTGDTIFILNPTLQDMGKYSATGSLSGCTGSTGFATVNVFELPKPIITGELAICPGIATTLSAINSIPGGTATIDTYTWKFNGVPIVPSNTSTITVKEEGVYELVIKNSNACKDTSAKAIVKFNKRPEINETSAVVDSTNCVLPTGGITKITATGVPVLSYTWYQPPATVIFNSTTTADLKDVVAGNYFLVVEDGNGCKDSSKVYTINDFHTPTKPGDIGDKVYCDGESLDPITATGSGGIYTWYNQNMTQIFTGNTYTPTFVKPGGTLYISETVNGCTSKLDTVVIVINPLPSGNAGPDKHILCSGPTIKLDGTGSTGNFNYTWVPASGVASGGNTLTPFVKDAGTYTLTVTDALTGCYVQDQVTVIKDPIPLASFTANPLTGEAPLTVNFTNTSTGSNMYDWDFGDKNTSTDINPTNIFDAGEYKVKLTVSDNGSCPSIAYVTIKVVEKLVYVIPNIFTPNGDGRNDLYTITSTGIEELTGEIYDRWGLKLFSWNQKNDGWDGRSPSGAAATAGTYFYIIKIKPQNGQDILVEKGQVTLIR